jgi:Recombination endonuclease VII
MVRGMKKLYPSSTPARRAAYRQKYIASGKAKAYRQKYYASEKGKAERLRYRLKQRYNISVQAFNQMMAQQNGVCAICREFSEETLFVDHDHKTGRVRALLCRHCNLAIGFLRESPLLARAAATYLEQQLTKEFTGE